jgi:sulfite exporter TauE/SafE
MLSSIHPLGERARSNRWWLTVTAFTVGASVTGAVVGLGLGASGARLLRSVSHSSITWAAATVVIVAAILDLARVSPPGPERQVNEAWIGHYRGWVYGGAFGIELGTGIMTYVVTWGVYATFAVEFLSRSPLGGLFIGGVFGFGRSLALLAARFIDRPSRLTAFHERMASLGPVVRRTAGASMALLGTIGVIGAIQ